MSKQNDYSAPTGQPAGWSNNKEQGYSAQQQPSYNNQTQDRGYGGGYQQQGYQQQGYQQNYPPQQGYPQQGYYQQQPQPMYVQQNVPSNNSSGCLGGCLAALCVCCALDMLF